MMNRARLLFSLALNLLLLTHSTLGQFQQMTFLPPTDEPEPAYSIVSAGGTDRIAFVYQKNLYTADGTPTGTKMFDAAYDNIIVNGPLGYVYYSNGTDWKYFNPTTNKITVIYSWNWNPPGYVFYGYPLPFNTTTKTYAIWHIPHYYQIESFNPATMQTYKIEADIPDSPFDPTPLDAAVYKDQIVTRFSLKPPGVSVNPADLYYLPSNIYSAPYIGAVFFAYSQPNGTGLELWRTDLTTYSLVADINPGPGNSNPRYFCDVPGVGLFFFANPTDDLGLISLFWTDGVHTVKRLHDFTMIPPTFVPTVRVGSRVVFIITNSEGDHLWSSDGTVEGTIDILRIVDNQLTSTGDLGYFVTDSADYGLELYQTDGTVAGTFRVPFETVPGPGNSYPTGLTPIGEDLFFNAYTPDGQIQVFKYSPEHVAHDPLIVFDPVKQWLPDGVRYHWGGSGSCSVISKKAPSNLPLSDGVPVNSSITQSVFHVHVKNDFYGCGEYYHSFIDLTGAKELRFWIQSTAYAKVEVEVDKPCAPYQPISGQDPCKPALYIPSTQGQWKSMGIPLNDRPANEFTRTYSPFIVTALEEGNVNFANIVVVY